MLFKQKFSDGTLVSFDLISNKKRSIVLQTLYLNRADYQKKKSAETLLMQNTSAHTPKAGVGQTSSTSISQHSENINSKSLESEDIRYSDREDFNELKRKLKEEYGVDTAEELALSDEYLKNYGGVLNKTQFRIPFFDRVHEAVKQNTDSDGNMFGR